MHFLKVYFPKMYFPKVYFFIKNFWDLENYGKLGFLGSGKLWIFSSWKNLDNLNLWRGKAFITIFSSSSSSCHQRHHHLEDDIDDDI